MKRQWCRGKKNKKKMLQVTENDGLMVIEIGVDLVRSGCGRSAWHSNSGAVMVVVVH